MVREALSYGCGSFEHRKDPVSMILRQGIEIAVRMDFIEILFVVIIQTGEHTVVRHMMTVNGDIVGRFVHITAFPCIDRTKPAVLPVKAMV